MTDLTPYPGDELPREDDDDKIIAAMEREERMLELAKRCAMSAPAFTPGPWEAIKGVEQSDDMRCGVAAVRGGTRYLVATIENGAPGDFCDTEFANARLIAAAPELYEALKKLSFMAQTSAGTAGRDEQLVEAIHAGNVALAKARGEQ